MTRVSTLIIFFASVWKQGREYLKPGATLHSNKHSQTHRHHLVVRNVAGSIPSKDAKGLDMTPNAFSLEHEREVRVSVTHADRKNWLSIPRTTTPDLQMSRQVVDVAALRKPKRRQTHKL